MQFQRITLPSDADEWLWNAELQASGGATLVLSDAPPLGYHFYMERLVDGGRLELLPGRSVPVSDGHQRLRFRLTNQSLGWDVRDIAPAVTQLLPIYPNPVNPETWIPFTLLEAGQVDISIQDVVGRHVRRLSLEMLPAGRYSEKARAGYWDGRNETGEFVASGAYFIVFQTEEYHQTRRVLLLK